MEEMSHPTDLHDLWSFENGEVVNRGDGAAINDLLATKLEKIGTHDEGWTTIYRHRETQQVWELSYPQSEMHGGGPRRLRLIG